MASEDELAAECHAPSQSGRVLWGDVHKEYILKDSGEVGHQVGNLLAQGSGENIICNFAILKLPQN